MAKSDKLHTLRNVLVILTVLLMIAVVVFQWLEIDKFEIQDHMASTIKGLFSSADTSQVAPPAP